ncbi:MAG: hypothetical protein RIE73_25575 [Coleofasciculus sp. C1-SOL-03]|jgi:hypothetical protein|uniref:hypothetical protein n=1 Tax=Coleofasciculus sp. C1-SOL-03 TaxID=3069522 RepID=UPI0032F9F794
MNKRHPSDVLMLLTHLGKSATINKIDRAGFAFVIDYNRRLSPRLTQADQTWLTEHLKSQDLINSSDD